MIYLAWGLFLFLVLLGFLGIIIPFLPDMLLIFAGILIFALLTHFQNISFGLLALLFGLSLFGFLFDYLGTIFSAKKAGASKWGIFGAILGGIVGVFIFNIFGFLIGAVFGAILFEIIFEKKEMDKAINSGVGAFFGLFFSFIAKIILSVVIITLFLRAVL